MTLLSAFGGGLWIIPIGIFLGAAYSAYRGYKASKSGSHYQNQQTGQYVDTPGNIPFYKTGGGIFAIILTAVLIVVVILMENDK